MRGPWGCFGAGLLDGYARLGDLDLPRAGWRERVVEWDRREGRVEL